MNGLALAASIAALCVYILALIHVPRFAPSTEVLECDRNGGYWSSAQGICQLSESPAAGMAS